MSGSRVKQFRRMASKFNKEVFKDFVIEISIMPFWSRLKFCLNMAFLRHGLQKGLKDEIKARRKFTVDGDKIKKGEK